MTLRFGPEYFEDKEPSEETVQATHLAKTNGYTIAYPASFLKKLDRNFVAPVETQADTPDEESLKGKVSNKLKK